VSRPCLAFFFLVSAFLVACHSSIPDDALRLNGESLKQRQIQTRSYQTDDETKVLTACAALLQDLGFNIDESEPRLGTITGSKNRSAVSAGQVIGSVIAAFFGVNVPWDRSQNMRVSVVTMPVEEKKIILVRVTFQRIVWNTAGQISKREGLTEPGIYQEFFARLSKSLFLQAQEAL
jgi:hypothetical protein